MSKSIYTIALGTETEVQENRDKIGNYLGEILTKKYAVDGARFGRSYFDVKGYDFYQLEYSINITNRNDKEIPLLFMISEVFDENDSFNVVLKNIAHQGKEMIYVFSVIRG